jgi:hypothetical protein
MAKMESFRSWPEMEEVQIAFWQSFFRPIS